MSHRRVSLKTRAKRLTCPHCGPSDSRYTLLCVARVKPGEDSFGGDVDPPLEVDANGLVACGMQWEPNT